MAENEKNKINELESSADSLLARLSGQFEPSKKENPVVEKQENGAEMNTAEFEVNDVLPSEDESVVLAEEASLDAGNESTPSQLELFDVPAVEERPAENTTVTDSKTELDKSLGGLSEEKYDELFEKYLGGDNKSGGSDFESLHEFIIDRQGEEGSKSLPSDDTSESIRDAESFVAEQPQAAEPETDEENDDEYFRMMKTEKVTIKQDTAEESELEKDIKDAETYVEENYSDNNDNKPEKNPKNIDAFSTNPAIKRGKEKKSLFSSLFRKKEVEEDKTKLEDDYVDNLG
ncbi:MAG: hypothetical protein IJR55_05625, partial [Clostridia bacterium]|nr:hypothetical protein [Clostridia bacterium]